MLTKKTAGTITLFLKTCLASIDANATPIIAPSWIVINFYSYE